MKASLLNKLDVLQDRFEELTALLGDGEVISDQTKFRAYSKEYAELEPVVQGYKKLLGVQSDLEGAQALLKDNDPDMREMAVEEVREAKELLVTLESDKATLDVPAPVGGVVKELKVKLGDKVAEGTVVLAIRIQVRAWVAAHVGADRS